MRKKSHRMQRPRMRMTVTQKQQENNITMATISATMVKELREKSGAGIMDCKEALTSCDGDMEKAVDFLRKKGLATAAKGPEGPPAKGLSNPISIWAVRSA